MGFENTRDLMAELDANQDCIDAMVPLANDRAEAEADLKSAVAREMLRLRSDGLPASMVKAVAEGSNDAKAALVRLACAEALERANFEALLLHKRRADVIREQIQREWGSTR